MINDNLLYIVYTIHYITYHIKKVKRSPNSGFSSILETLYIPTSQGYVVDATDKQKHKFLIIK